MLLLKILKRFQMNGSCTKKVVQRFIKIYIQIYKKICIEVILMDAFLMQQKSREFLADNTS